MDRMAKLWKDVLGTDVGPDDSFFHFGGHSLKAARLAAAVREEFQVGIPLAEVLKRPTIRELSLFIRGLTAGDFNPVLPQEEREYYPLSSAQTRLYMLRQIDPQSTVYNGTMAWKAEGSPDIERARACFNKIMQRHGALRTSFQEIRGQPVQVIHQDIKIEVEILDSPLLTRFVSPFDLAVPPLFRVGIYSFPPAQPGSAPCHILIVDMHHIITDGISEDVIMKEFTEFYQGKTLPLPSLQYPDFSQWQLRRLESGELKKQEEFWLSYFAPPIPQLRMPADFPRLNAISFQGASIHTQIEKKNRDKVFALMESTRSTLFMVLLAALNVLLSKYSGQYDIIIGTASANRDHPDLHDVVGLVVETLVFRNFPTHEKTFFQFLEEVKTNTLDAYKNQEYPFRELTRKLGLETGTKRNPLFDVMLLVQNYSRSQLQVEGVSFTPYPIEEKIAKLDIYLEAWEKENAIDLDLEYSTTLFKRETMERFLRRYVYLLGGVAADPHQKIADIEILTPGERTPSIARDTVQPLEADFDF